MRTPEQAEQFKRDYLAQIDVNALNEVEKVLYAVAESKDLSNLPSMKLNKALENCPWILGTLTTPPSRLSPPPSFAFVAQRTALVSSGLS